MRAFPEVERPRCFTVDEGTVVSAPTAASTQPARTGMRATAWSLPSRAVAVFSGPVGFGVKIALLSLVNAVGIWAFVVLAHRHQWTAAVLVVAVTVVIDALYL